MSLSLRMNREALFIGTTLLVTNSPIQIKRMFSLVAINVQQLSTFADPLFIESRNVTNQNSEGLRESKTELENILTPSAQKIHRVSRCSGSSESTLTPSTREWFWGQVLRNYFECRSLGHFALKLGVSSKRQKIISKNVADPTPWTKPHLVRRSWARTTWTRTQPSLVRRVRAHVGSVANGLTLITIGLERVGIYTTQIFFAYPMWDLISKAKWEKLKFFL